MQTALSSVALNGLPQQAVGGQTYFLFGFSEHCRLSALELVGDVHEPVRRPVRHTSLFSGLFSGSTLPVGQGFAGLPSPERTALPEEGGCTLLLRASLALHAGLRGGASNPELIRYGLIREGWSWFFTSL